MSVERRDCSSICVRDNNFGQVLAHSLQYGTRLRVRTFVENLAQIAEPVYTRNEHTELLVFTNLLIYPSLPITDNVLGTGCKELGSNFISLIPGDAGVGHQNVYITNPIFNEFSYFFKLVREFRHTEISSLTCKFALDDKGANQSLFSNSDPRARKCPITSAIAGVEEGFDSLTKHFPDDSKA